ncbi:hypothetical protein [Ensifer aridi]|uniref:hypothetical protein n=1 Tax=Ensifer aridi TaxID=1708715 RepID=UPI000A122ED4|nr:hypothetical protein [Ensifer aridi]
MFRVSVLVFGLCLFGQTALCQEVTDGSTGTITPQELAALVASLPNFLKDPESARLSKLHLDPDNQDYVCGFLNAKNGFGGYVGDQPFRYGLKNGMLITDMNTPC